MRMCYKYQGLYRLECDCLHWGQSHQCFKLQQAIVQVRSQKRLSTWALSSTHAKVFYMSKTPIT